MGGELIDLDLAELANVANALALERSEIGGDSGVLEVDDAGEWLVEKTSNGDDREVASLCLHDGRLAIVLFPILKNGHTARV